MRTGGKGNKGESHVTCEVSIVGAENLNKIKSGVGGARKVDK